MQAFMLGLPDMGKAPWECKEVTCLMAENNFSDALY